MIVKHFDTLRLRERYDDHSRSEYDTLLREVVGSIREALAGSGLRFQIKHRVKDFEGYLQKLNLNEAGRPTIDRIEDLMGIRIVCPFLDDLGVAERLLSARFDITEVDKKYERHSFREFGYDATHLLLDLQDRNVEHPLPCVPAVCEIQLRTILQDAWAEVEHELIYKSDWPIPTYQIKRKLAALNANLTLSDIIFQELREFQREILRKQTKRRSLADDSVRLLSNGDIHSELFHADGNARAHDDLEKVIIDALNAHSEESYDTAISLYTRALEMTEVESVRSILRNHRGMAYLSLGKVDESHAEFLASIEANPNNHRAWYNLGIVLMSLQKLSVAQNAFETCLKLDPSFTDARVKRIRLLTELGDFQTAQDALTEMRRIAPESPDLGALQRLLADYRGAG